MDFVESKLEKSMNRKSQDVGRWMMAESSLFLFTPKTKLQVTNDMEQRTETEKPKLQSVGIVVILLLVGTMFVFVVWNSVPRIGGGVPVPVPIEVERTNAGEVTILQWVSFDVGSNKLAFGLRSDGSVVWGMPR